MSYYLECRPWYTYVEGAVPISIGEMKESVYGESEYIYIGVRDNEEAEWYENGTRRVFKRQAGHWMKLNERNQWKYLDVSIYLETYLTMKFYEAEVNEENMKKWKKKPERSIRW